LRRNVAVSVPDFFFTFLVFLFHKEVSEFGPRVVLLLGVLFKGVLWVKSVWGAVLVFFYGVFALGDFVITNDIDVQKVADAANKRPILGLSFF
jgi:hypothetical protein